VKITFNGRENVDFQQVGQAVALQPDTDYCLKARVRTKGVTTKSGLKLEVLKVGFACYGASESLAGDNEWREVAARFRTPSGRRGLREGTERED